MISPYSRNIDREKGDVRYLQGAQNHFVCDVSSDDVTVADQYKNCRYFECDEEGTIKFDYTDDSGNTRTRCVVAKAGINHYPNITKVYQYTSDSTDCTAGVYKDDGTQVTGIALIF